jgi:dTDP-4-amino-4,6-dideoxygalactose transaminase
MISRKITYSSLPKLSDIVCLPFSQTPDFKSISEPWIRDGDIGHWFSRSSWSIYALAVWRMKLTGKQSINIWVPQYFCNESLLLIRNIGANIVFYPIHKEGHPNVEFFPKIADEEEPDLFIHVHFFGQPISCNYAVEFCKNYTTWLIEDAAHVLKPINGIGEIGDFVLYSPHKLLAIPDGAILVARQNGPNELGLKYKLVSDFEAIYKTIIKKSNGHNFATTIWIVKRLLQRIGIRPKQSIPDFSYNSETNKLNIVAPRMSNIAKRLLKKDIRRLDELASKRKLTASAWVSLMKGIFPDTLCKAIHFNGTPYLACFEATNSEIAANLYTSLNKIGLPVSTWPDLPPEVLNKLEINEIAIGLRNTRVYLPVHETVNIDKLTSYSRAIRKFYNRKWGLKRITTNSEWRNLWTLSEMKSLPQAWEYGSAKEIAEGWKAQRYLIVDENNRPLALFQVLIRKFFGLKLAARVNRGPILLSGGEESKISLALSAIDVLVRKLRLRQWGIIQIAPLLPPDHFVEKALNSMGFKKRPDFSMDSALLSLESSEENLMMGLNGKWRNCLRKGQKLGVTIELDKGGEHHFQILLDFYKMQQVEKKFEGTSEEMLYALKVSQNENFKFNLFIAKENLECIGILVTIQFGDFTEYLIGVTNAQGRTNQANSVLLWEAILEAKRNGSKWFDVGGLAQNTPKGIADFKKGLNPKPYEIVGEWRKWM